MKTRRKKIVCKRDHNLNEPENLYWYRGNRRCKPCSILRVYQWREANPEYYKKQKSVTLT